MANPGQYPVGTPYLGTSASPAYSGIFIPAIWSGKFVEKFYDATVLGAIASTDYEGEIRNFGDTVYIRTNPTITINAYTTDQVLAVQRPSSNLVTLSINQGAYFNTVLDDVFEIQADVDLLSNWADNASEQMKVYVDTLILVPASIGNNVSGVTTLLVTPGGSQNTAYPAGRLSQSLNFGASTNSTIFVASSKYYGAPLWLGRAPSTTTPTGTYYGIAMAAANAAQGWTALSPRGILDFIIDAGQSLDEQRCPETGRWLVLPAWAAAMIKRSNFQQAYLTGDAVSIARNGRLGMIDRFTVYVSNLLPIGSGAGAGTAGATSALATSMATSLATGEYAAYWGHNLGLTFASQMTKVETLRSESTFGTLMRGLQVWGFQVINPTIVGYAVISNSGF
ncbi:MAG: hypothetical protein ACHQ9S_18840 [Candidatus Binatia bacterium]